MRAVILETYGPPEVMRLAEVATPAPKDNEVLVRIFASIATPSDVAFRSAKPFIVRFFFGLLRPKFPILGDGFAGVIEAVGGAVTRFAPGSRVYGAADTAFGTYAEYTCVPETGSLATMPAGTSFADAVAIGEGFLTAMPFLRDEAKLRAGQKILINGASGSVGTMAVMLAKHFGAEVTGVCSGVNVALVKSLGADAVIDYTKRDFTADAGVYDVIFDAVGKSSFSRCRRALKPGGVYMTTVPSIGIVWHMLTKRGGGKRALLATTGLRPASAKAKDLALLTEMIEAGALRAVIDRRYPLEEIVAAHRYVETGRKKGSVVITIGTDEPPRPAP